MWSNTLFVSIFYLLVSGCAWSMLPGDFPPYKTVYHYLRKWRIEGVWQQLNDRLRRMVRVKAGRHPSPSAAILDGQTRRLSTMLSKAVGYDAAKHIKGRKLHLLVDTMGLVMVAVVTAASVGERDGAPIVFAAIRGRFPRLLWIWLDGGYSGGDFACWVLQPTTGFCGWCAVLSRVEVLSNCRCGGESSARLVG